MIAITHLGSIKKSILKVFLWHIKKIIQVFDSQTILQIACLFLPLTKKALLLDRSRAFDFKKRI
ncbi:MAG: hypothetical protein EAZ57_05880 [Cytophagales bacterium]|nr:MAG: hypothetical protein EAZ67_06785 [Cytophagales bacterium]TAF60878.1 MAG: hypothetical protein EAZ57_05880 [Cytophagales bacterium]